MSEPTLSDLMLAIKEWNGKVDSLDTKVDTVEMNLSNKIDQVEANLSNRISEGEQAVSEVKNDHHDIGYIQDRLLQQDKMIWKINQKLKMTSSE